MLSRCSWIAFHFANLSPVWLSTLVPAVWCGLATSFTFFCPSDVRPLRFLDLLTGCFSSLRMVAEDLCCLLVLSSAALCKLWQCSLLFCSTEDSVGLSFCAQICLGKFRKFRRAELCPVICLSGKLDFQHVNHTCWDDPFQFLYLKVAWPVVHHYPELLRSKFKYVSSNLTPWTDGHFMWLEFFSALLWLAWLANAALCG